MSPYTKLSELRRLVKVHCTTGLKAKITNRKPIYSLYTDQVQNSEMK